MESDTEVYVVSFSSGYVQSFVSMSHDYFARTVREANAGHVEVHCRNDRWVPRGGGITSGISSEAPLVCGGNGQVDRRGQARVSVDDDVRR